MQINYGIQAMLECATDAHADAVLGAWGTFMRAQLASYGLTTDDPEYTDFDSTENLVFGRVWVQVPESVAQVHAQVAEIMCKSAVNAGAVIVSYRCNREQSDALQAIAKAHKCDGDDEECDGEVWGTVYCYETPALLAILRM